MILEAARIYISAYEMITGQRFVLPPVGQRPLERIRANLAKYFTVPA